MYEVKVRTEHRPEASAGRAERQRGLVADQRSGQTLMAIVAGCGVDRAEICGTVRIDDHRDDDQDGLATGHRRGGVCAGAQVGCHHSLGQQLRQPGLTREGRDSGVDRVDHGRLDVDTDDVMPLTGALHRQRKPHPLPNATTQIFTRPPQR